MRTGLAAPLILTLSPACGGLTRGLRLDPIAGSWRCDGRQVGVARAQAAAALAATTGAQVDWI